MSTIVRTITPTIRDVILNDKRFKLASSPEPDLLFSVRFFHGEKNVLKRCFTEKKWGRNKKKLITAVMKLLKCSSVYAVNDENDIVS